VIAESVRAQILERHVEHPALDGAPDEARTQERLE
jgi:hypothetical protein